MGGQKAGYGHTTMTRTGDRIRTAVSFLLRIGRVDQSVEVEMKQWTEETLDGAPIRFGTDMHASIMKTGMQGSVDGGRVTIVTSQYGMEQTQTFDYPAGALMAWGLFRESLLRGFTPGTRYTTKTYAPELRLDGAVQATTVVGEWETFAYRGQTIRGQRVTVTLVSPIGTMEVVSWVDRDGLPLKALLPMPGLGNMEMIVVDEATALEGFVPPEIFLTSVIQANRKISPKTAQRIRYRVRARNPAQGGQIDLTQLPQTDMQTVIQRPDGSIDVVVSRQSHRPGKTGKTGAPKATADQQDEYLASNLMINLDDPKLVELARRAAGGGGVEKDPYQLADRLRRFVSEYVTTKNLNVGFATASEVSRTREGDCSEHGVLLAALGRLNGLPSRVVVGLAYVPVFGKHQDIFGYHLWTQFLIDGRWIDVDAALGETQCSPTRIAFATSSLKNSGLADLSLPLLTKIGAIDVEILQIDPIQPTKP